MAEWGLQKPMVVTDWRVEPIAESKFIIPRKLTFKQNGVARRWDVIESSGACAILLYNVDRDAYVFVRQFRPAIYFSRYADRLGIDADGHARAPLVPGDRGLTLEMIGGLMDKEHADEVGTVTEEALEEAGYRVPRAAVRLVAVSSLGVGTSGGPLHLYFAQVRDADVVAGAGGGLAEEGEFIEVVHVPTERLPRALGRDGDGRVPAGARFVVEWHLRQRGEAGLAVQRRIDAEQAATMQRIQAGTAAPADWQAASGFFQECTPDDEGEEVLPVASAGPVPVVDLEPEAVAVDWRASSAAAGHKRPATAPQAGLISKAAGVVMTPSVSIGAMLAFGCVVGAGVFVACRHLKR